MSCCSSFILSKAFYIWHVILLVKGIPSIWFFHVNFDQRNLHFWHPHTFFDRSLRCSHIQRVFLSMGKLLRLTSSTTAKDIKQCLFRRREVFHSETHSIFKSRALLSYIHLSKIQHSASLFFVCGVSISCAERNAEEAQYFNRYI